MDFGSRGSKSAPGPSQKLGQWLQPGGHCDGDNEVARVAKREVEEETGLIDFTMILGNIFDLDIHNIPAWGTIPEHLHYDVRFLVLCDSNQAMMKSDESNDLQWFDLKVVNEISTDTSLLRMVEKTVGQA